MDYRPLGSLHMSHHVERAAEFRRLAHENSDGVVEAGARAAADRVRARWMLAAGWRLAYADANTISIGCQRVTKPSRS